MTMKYGWCLLLLLLTACAPYIDERREAGQIAHVGQSKPNRVAICYHGWWTDDDELLSMAKEACAQNGRVAQYDEDKTFNCTFFTPSTRFFKCVAKKKAKK